MAPVTTLFSGIRICNFSSPHEFKFDDGSTLPACDRERSQKLTLKAKEEETQQENWVDIQILFQMSEPVERELQELQTREDIDIILIPFPVMESLKRAGMEIGKCRVVRMKDRTNKIAFSNRFCI